MYPNPHQIAPQITASAARAIRIFTVSFNSLPATHSKASATTSPQLATSHRG